MKSNCVLDNEEGLHPVVLPLLPSWCLRHPHLGEKPFVGPSPSPECIVREAEDGNEVETIPETPAPTLVVGKPSGPSWLRPDFVIPEDEVGLAALCDEIETVTPPIHNLPFTNIYLSARVG